MTSRKALFRNISLFFLLVFSNFLFSKILVDGKLDEQEWKSAQQINKFYQVFPFTLEEPEQKTTVLVYETENGLFVGYINYQPKKTMRTQLHERDADNANADKVGISVDFDGDSLMAYSFTVSLGGSLWDAVYSNENEKKKDWDADWIAKTSISDEAWYAEFFIPWTVAPMKIQSIGYGAGQKDFEGFSNVLKIVRGVASTQLQLDTVKILETNVDDVSGEVLGNMIEKIMALGAKDVTISSAITKKGRPTNLVSVICDSDTMNSIMELLVAETGTLGVRVRTSQRYIVPRTVKTISVDIQGQSFDVRYKTRELNNGSHFKIESDDIKEISGVLSISFKETEELLNQEIRKKL